jgi:hypothetical protein
MYHHMTFWSPAPLQCRSPLPIQPPAAAFDEYLLLRMPPLVLPAAWLHPRLP